MFVGIHVRVYLKCTPYLRIYIDDISACIQVAQLYHRVACKPVNVYIIYDI